MRWMNRLRYSRVLNSHLSEGDLVMKIEDACNQKKGENS